MLNKSSRKSGILIQMIPFVKSSLEKTKVEWNTQQPCSKKSQIAWDGNKKWWSLTTNENWHKQDPQSKEPRRVIVLKVDFPSEARNLRHNKVTCESWDIFTCDSDSTKLPEFSGGAVSFKAPPRLHGSLGTSSLYIVKGSTSHMPTCDYINVSVISKQETHKPCDSNSSNCDDSSKFEIKEPNSETPDSSPHELELPTST